MSLKNSIQVIPVATFNAANLTALYQPVNAGGISHPCFMLRISNFNTEGIIFSFDGITDNDYMNPDQVIELKGGMQASSPQNSCALWAKGTTLYVRAAAAGAGIITLSGYYQNRGA